jgi:hypothetical protein
MKNTKITLLFLATLWSGLSVLTSCSDSGVTPIDEDDEAPLVIIDDIELSNFDFNTAPGVYEEFALYIDQDGTTLQDPDDNNCWDIASDVSDLPLHLLCDELEITNMDNPINIYLAAINSNTGQLELISGTGIIPEAHYSTSNSPKTLVFNSTNGVVAFTLKINFISDTQ